MRVGVVTPVLNAEGWIAETAASIFRQKGLTESGIELVYVIQDGGSTDSTVARAHEVTDAFAPDNAQVHIRSEADAGMYDGLARGMTFLDSLGGADWYAYLNAGALWNSTCTSLLARVDRAAQVQWLMGLHAYFAPDTSVVHTRLPFRYRRNFLRQGLYGRGLPTVQQESTLWRRTIHSTIDFNRLPGFRLAGDSYLWWSLAEYAEPFVMEAVLGGFRYHGNHLGVNQDQYRAEIASFAGDIPVSARAQIAAERALWEQPARVKQRLNPHLLRFDTSTHTWRNRTSHVVIPGSAI